MISKRSGLVLMAALLVAFGSVALVARSTVSTAAADSAEQKLNQILVDSPNLPATTRFTEDEVNSYLYYNTQLPRGVSKLNVSFLPGTVSGSAEVNFDSLTASSPADESPSMLGYLLRGSHTIASEGSLSAANGVARFELRSASIDDIPLPRPLVDFLIDSYLKRRFPGLDIDSPFRLPPTVDSVRIGQGNVDVNTKHH